MSAEESKTEVTRVSAAFKHPDIRAQIEDWFVYHSPRPGQTDRYMAIREAAKQLAIAIVGNSAPGDDQTVAIRKVREAVMVANQAIACESEATSEAYRTK